MPRRTLVAVLALCAACPSPSVVDGGTGKLPPQVFLTADDSNVIGQAVTGKVNVSGCKNVTQVQLLQKGNFLADLNYTASPTSWTLGPGNLAALYSQLGFATELTLTAKVVCDDGRTNTSQAVGVSFFPVVSHLSNGNEMWPDSFTATGGLSGTPVLVTGCVQSQAGAVGLASFDTSGNVVYSNLALPFSCTSNLSISARSKTSGVRWMLEPGVGAVAVDDTLTVKKSILGNFKRMGVSTTGVAILWEDTNTNTNIYKVDPFVSTNDWKYTGVNGIMNSDPVVDVGNRVVWASMWVYNYGVSPIVGELLAYEFDLDTPTLRNGIGTSGPPVVLRQTYGDIVNRPLMPTGAFNADGTLYFQPILSQDNAGVVHTTVFACATGGECSGAARRWTSQTFNGVTNQVYPFSAGNALAVFGPYQVWVLDAQTGTISNLGEAAFAPTAPLEVLGIQPGVNSELYLLNGPSGGYPVEVVAVDSAQSGELYRFTYGSGSTAPGSITMGVDDTGQAWYRLGSDIVKPLTLSEYRTARGPTPTP